MANAPADPVKYAIEGEHHPEYSLAKTLILRVKLSCAVLHQQIALISRSPSAHAVHASLIGAAAMEASGSTWDDAVKVIQFVKETVDRMRHVGGFLDDDSFAALKDAPTCSRVVMCSIARMIPSLAAVMQVGWSVPTADECSRFGLPALKQGWMARKSAVALPMVKVSEEGKVLEASSSSFRATFVMPSSAETGMPLLPRPGTDALGVASAYAFYSRAEDSPWSSCLDRSLEYVDTASTMLANETLKPCREEDGVLNRAVMHKLAVSDGVHACVMEVRLGALAALSIQGTGTMRL